MSTALATLTNIAGVQTVNLADYSKETSFLPRLQLFSSQAKACSKELIAPGRYGVPRGDDIEDLGKTVDVLPIAVRDKALDTSVDPPVAVYDASDKMFQDIKTRAGGKDSGCMYGPSILVFERSTGKFFELFLGNASGRMEAKNLAPFLPISEQQAKAAGIKAKPPTPCTLSAKLVQRGNQAWHAPVVGKCSTPFTNLPAVEEIQNEVSKFLNPKKAEVETQEQKRSR